MKPNVTPWPRRYQTALRKYIGPDRKSTLRPAFELGREAAVLKLETLDVARIHEQALKALILPSDTSSGRQRIIERAKQFFEETLVPIEQTHHAAVEDARQVAQLKQTLRERTAQSADSTRRLKRVVVRRQASETALDASGKQHAKLVQKSHSLQSELQAQMHTIMSANEEQRQKTSLQLQNEIVQLLVAIHVRLLTLKKAAKANTDSLKKEIAETQRLVTQSVQTIQRLTNESDDHNEK